MNVSAIDPVAAAPVQSAAAANAPARKTDQPAARRAPATAPQPSVTALATPAATVTTTSVPATVKPQDRALYLQILKSVGGNVSAALAALAALEAKQAEG
jgi:hypothetical protein